jgi:hypothetical protein
MLLENTGNIDVAPSRVQFRIFDATGNVLLEDVKHKGKITKVAPYATQEIVAEVPTRLPSGTYIARYQIYNDDELKQEGEVNLNVLPYGTLQVAGFGFMGLSLAHQVSVLLPVFAFLSLIVFALYSIRQRRLKTRPE